MLKKNKLLKPKLAQSKAPNQYHTFRLRICPTPMKRNFSSLKKFMSSAKLISKVQNHPKISHRLKLVLKMIIFKRKIQTKRSKMSSSLAKKKSKSSKYHNALMKKIKPTSMKTNKFMALRYLSNTSNKRKRKRKTTQSQSKKSYKTQISIISIQKC